MEYSASEGKAWAREHLVGQWTTMITPFTADDELDLDGLRHNIDHVLGLGTRGMGFSWNMGEFWSLTHEERLRLLEAVPDLVKHRARIAFQATGTSLKEVVATCQEAGRLGYDFAIVAPPYLMTHTEEQVLDFVARVSERAGIGLAFYNSPQFGITLSARALSKLADLPNVIAIKEASFNQSLSIDAHLDAGKKVVVSTPDEEIFFFEGFYGFHQQVMFANTSDWRFDTAKEPNYGKFIDLATHSRLAEARSLYERIWPIKSVSRRWWSRIAGRTGGSLPVQMVKYWGELMGLKAGPVRPPLSPLSEVERTELRADLGRLGLIDR